MSAAMCGHQRPVRADAGIVSRDGRPMTYAHGQHAAYVLDRCRCEPCRLANRAYEHRRRHALIPAFVGAGEARAHIISLGKHGVGRKQVAKISGVAGGTLSKLMFGDRRRGSPPSKRIRVATHEAIMAVMPSDIAAGNKQAIPAGPTWVLLDEMIAAGVARREIARALGTAGLQIKRTTVSPANRDKVRRLHADWEAGRWTPMRRDSWGNSTALPAPTRRPRTPEQAAEAYDNRLALMTALADALDARLERPWRAQAACTGRPSHLWFPQRGDALTTDAAVKICKACLCRRECLMSNLDATDGIYGGLTARARRRLRAELAEHPDAGVMAREHGTVRGYRDHLLGDEEPCERCKAANARYQREYNARRRELRDSAGVIERSVA